ncbi:HTH-type transcriptional activator Btr [compost metagenome]
MSKSDLRLKHITEQVGYSDEFYFSRKFKQEVGVSPTIYMKTRRRKIAAYSSSIAGHMLALNIIPFAAPIHPKWTAYYHKMYRNDIPFHLSAYRINLDWESNIEMLSQAKPDMVISQDGLSPLEQEKLERIAPVLYVPSKEMNWQEQFRLTAEFVGAATEAELWLLKYQQKVKIARERLKKEVKDDSFLVLSMYKQSLFIYNNRGIEEVCYQNLGMRASFQIDPLVTEQEIGVDQIAILNPDRILMNVCLESESLNSWKQLQTTSVWRDLKAVRSNRVYRIASDPWRDYSASAFDRMVDQVVTLLTGDRP